MRTQSNHLLAKRPEYIKQHLVSFDILQKIYKASLKFMTPLNKEETYTVLLDEAIKLVSANYGHIVLKEEGGYKKVYSSSPASFKSPVKPRGFVHKVFTKRVPIIAEVNKTFKDHPELKEQGIKSTILIPMANKGESLGVLTLNSTNKHHFGEEELNILTLFGAMATLAIRKAQLYDELSKALETRDLFISMAAHELRTPLTAISGYSQLLKTKSERFGSREAKWIEELSWEVLRMTNLVNELLEVNKARKNELNYVLKECSMNQIIDRALMDFRFSHPERRVVFTSKAGEGKDKIIGDFDKLLQANINLLENASKFSPPNTGITITLTHRSSCLKISIKDCGKGIPEEEHHKIFESFYKGSNNSREGMGVGLYLVKNIIDRHHGTVSVKSKLNEGTTVEIKLPSAKI